MKSNIFYLQEQWQRTSFDCRNDLNQWMNTKNDKDNDTVVYEWNEMKLLETATIVSSDDCNKDDSHILLISMQSPLDRNVFKKPYLQVKKTNGQYGIYAMGTIKADSVITMAVAEELRDFERKNKVETADYFHLGFSFMQCIQEEDEKKFNAIVTTNGVVTAIQEIKKGEEIICMQTKEKKYDFWHCLVRAGLPEDRNDPAEFGVVDCVYKTYEGWQFRLKYPYNETSEDQIYQFIVDEKELMKRVLFTEEGTSD